MMEVVFRRAPGVIYDLAQILIKKLNDDSKWKNQVVDPEHKEKDLTYAKFWTDQFEDPEPDLSVFFYLKDEKAATYFSQVFNTIVDCRGESMSKEDFLEYFSQTERVRNEICQFYLDAEIDIQNIRSVSSAINKRNDYDSQFKFLLLSFFINTELVLNQMKAIFEIYYDQMQRFFEKRANELMVRQENLEIDDVCQRISESFKRRGRKKEIRKSVVSLTLLSQYTFWYMNLDEAAWFILGEKYDRDIKRVEPELQVDIAVFGNAMGDRNRERIIELILKEGEQSSSNIAKKLGLALNTVSYHVEIMKRANLLCYRNEGKVTYYWLNAKACQKAADQIREWILGENL